MRDLCRWLTNEFSLMRLLPCRHFEDCYVTLVDAFSHPELLVPRTKRWAEAKVLADCISFKVSTRFCLTQFRRIDIPSSPDQQALPLP